jgi:hypothetical protein
MLPVLLRHDGDAADPAGADGIEASTEGDILSAIQDE